MIEKSKKQKANLAFLEGRGLMDLGDVKKALSKFNQANKLDSKNTKTMEFIAAAWAKLNKLKLSLTYAQEMIKAEPDNYRGYFISARYALECSLLECAKNYIDMAHVKNINKEHYFQVESLRSEISKRIGNKQESLEIAEEITNSESDNAFAWHLAGKRAYELQKLDKAIDYFYLAIKYNNENVEILQNLAEVLNLKDRTKESDEILLLLRNNNNELFWLKKADNYFVKYRYKEALNCYESGYLETKSNRILKELIQLSISLQEKITFLKYESEYSQICSDEERKVLEYAKIRLGINELPSNYGIKIDDNNRLVGSYLTKKDIIIAKNNFGVYSMPHKITGLCLHREPNFGVYIMEGLSHSVRLYTDLSVQNNSYFFVHMPHYVSSEDIRKQLSFFHYVTDNKFSSERVIILSNTIEDLEIFHSLGMTRSFFCNQNCWIDYELFYHKKMDKMYDMVMNSRPEKGTKRPYLADKVDNLAIIRGALVRHSDYWPLEQLNPKYINKQRLTPTEVVNILNSAYCGGIFSYKEGACYSSSEYLLCGLPVISTKSLGGRDFWYNSNNSIIVDDDVDSVKDGVNTAIENIKNGIWLPEKIRQNHVDVSNQLRDDFVSKLHSIFIENNINQNAREVFKEKYVHQFKCNTGYNGL